MIPCINIRSVFGGPSAARDAADAEFLHSAEKIGFIQVTGFDGNLDLAVGRREALKRIFTLPSDSLQVLLRQKFAPAHINVYRGWFPLQEGHPTYKEGIDIGPSVWLERETPDAADPLCEATPLPKEADLPGWRATVSQHYAEMTLLGQVIMRSLARGMSLPESYFDEIFDRGISTLRLIRYPRRATGEASGLVGAPHVDSGLVTLLVQDGVSGLQVRGLNGTFVDVPPREDAVTVNFGRLLELWSGGRIRATEHQVVGGNETRHSFPFFYEPRVDALIEPLPKGNTQPFLPFQYGDFLWQATIRFVEFRGMESLRAPRGDAMAAIAASHYKLSS